MTSIISQKLSWNFSLFITLLCTLLLSSCEEVNQPAASGGQASPTETVTEASFLPDTITYAEAEILINNFKEESLDDLKGDFFFGGKQTNADKVISLELNAAQRNIFYQELHQCFENNNKAVRILIHMASRGTQNTNATNEKPAFAPLLELLVDSTQRSTCYPLRAFSSSFLSAFDQLYAWQDKSNTDCPSLDCSKSEIPVSPNCARELVSRWDSISVADIPQQLYLNQNIGNLKDRIQYYTFAEEDTRQIYDYLTKLKNESKSFFFYLHLGNLMANDCVPFRTVLHLDDNDINASQTPDRALDTPAYFEFAMPCPTYCDVKPGL